MFKANNLTKKNLKDIAKEEGESRSIKENIHKIWDKYVKHTNCTKTKDKIWFSSTQPRQKHHVINLFSKAMDSAKSSK